METLKLEHLAPYLPYGLQIQLEGKIKELIGLESPYKTNDNFFIRGQVREIGGTYRQTHSMCLTEKTAHLCKPLLLPLSELTDEQWIEVFEVGFQALNREPKLLSDVFIEKPINRVSIYTKDTGNMVVSFNYVNNQFITDTLAFNQISALKHLRKLHADLDSLLDKGLAISKV